MHPVTQSHYRKISHEVLIYPATTRHMIIKNSDYEHRKKVAINAYNGNIKQQRVLSKPGIWKDKNDLPACVITSSPRRKKNQNLKLKSLK